MECPTCNSQDSTKNGWFLTYSDELSGEPFFFFDGIITRPLHIKHYQKMDPFTIGNEDICAKTVADNLSKILRIKESRNSYWIW